MARIRTTNGRVGRRQHFHSYSRGVRNHWRRRTGGTNIGAQGFRHTHNGVRHGHDFSPSVQQHWGRNPGGYSVHHEGYYHSHNSHHRDDMDRCPPGQHSMPDDTCMEGAYHGDPNVSGYGSDNGGNMAYRKRARKRRRVKRTPRRGRDSY